MVEQDNFIKGKWYKVKGDKGQFTYYVKFNYIEKEFAKSSEFINYTGKNHHYCYTSDNLSKIDNKIVDISEIAPYLPKNHPDLIISNPLNNLELW